VGDIKSAREIAQEKAEKLGELSPEERRKQREDRCHLIGKSLTDKYLNGHDVKRLEAELNKYNNEDKESIRQKALRQLIERIDLRNDFVLDRISQGILSLAKTETSTGTMGKIKELFQEYKEAEEGEGQGIEKAGREILHQLRISGTAIGQINIRAKEEWQKKLEEMTPPFEERLSKLKQELISA